jgi:hypothetical protein
MGRTLLTVTLAFVLSLAPTAWAQPLRTAKVGDRMGSIIVGLTQVTLDSGACRTPQGLVPVRRVAYVVPGRVTNEENASAIAFVVVTGQVAVLATFDEANMDEPVTIYADTDGVGLVTNVWPVTDAPKACDVIRDLHYGNALLVPQ